MGAVEINIALHRRRLNVNFGQSTVAFHDFSNTGNSKLLIQLQSRSNSHARTSKFKPLISTTRQSTAGKDLPVVHRWGF